MQETYITSTRKKLKRLKILHLGCCYAEEKEKEGKLRMISQGAGVAGTEEAMFVTKNYKFGLSVCLSDCLQYVCPLPVHALNCINILAFPWNLYMSLRYNMACLLLKMRYVNL